MFLCVAEAKGHVSPCRLRPRVMFLRVAEAKGHVSPCS